jgi:signal transduction histidine kinase
MLQRIKNKIVSKIAALIIIEIILIIGSFGVLSYYQSQQSSLANTINIAGKNRYLTSNLLLQTESYLDGVSNIFQLNAAMNALQSNILTLKQGGSISGIQLQPLPTAFDDMWNTINTKWTAFKTSIYNNLINPSHGDRIKEAAVAAAISNSTLRQQFNQSASDLIIVSDALVLKLAEQSNKNFSEPVILQSIFVPLNIGILVLILYLIRRILKPISVLTDAMSNVKEGNLEISVNEKGKDELSVLSRSFNLMIETIRNSVKKQEQLTHELAEVNEELKEASQLKDDFINVAAHELRTPIQPILGLAQILRLKIKGGDSHHHLNFSRDEQSRVLDIIIRNAKKLLLLEDNILDIARIESKTLKLNIEEFDLDHLIINVVQDTRDLIDSKRISLYYNKWAGASFVVNADKARLSQVLSNLLSNSIKFTEKGTIMISLAEKENQAVVTVKDTGRGIDEEILPKLFTKFATKSRRGVGLGLFICKTIVEAHGGKIWAENNDDGKGATFYLSLPTQMN